jgi:hypothetical protein
MTLVNGREISHAEVCCVVIPTQSPLHTEVPANFHLQWPSQRLISTKIGTYQQIL